MLPGKSAHKSTNKTNQASKPSVHFAITIVSIIVVAVVGKAKDTRSGISKAPTSVQWANNITTTGNARVVAKAPIGPPNSYEKDVVDDDDDDTVMVGSDGCF